MNHYSMSINYTLTTNMSSILLKRTLQNINVVEICFLDTCFISSKFKFSTKVYSVTTVNKNEFSSVIEDESKNKFTNKISKKLYKII